MKVSVIIPIYNVASFIQRCAESLMAQTLNEVEFIFVDDCTPDNSVERLHEVMGRFPQRTIRIIHHKKNKGLPTARNTGLAVATGEYIFHCDSDDFLETNALELLYNKAVVENADIAYCDFFLTFEKNERYMRVGDYTTTNTSLKAMLCGAMKYNVWNKLIRRSIYSDNDIHFPDGHSMGEDMTMLMLVACARKIAYVPKALYHYVKLNAGAFSNTFSRRHLDDIRYNSDRVITFLYQRYGEKIKEDITLFKLNVKFPFLITDDKEMYRLWQEWYPESNLFIDKAKLPMRSRLLQKAAAKEYWWYVAFYYRVVYKSIYGILYK